jgi:hypothetical protein
MAVGNDQLIHEDLLADVSQAAVTYMQDRNLIDGSVEARRLTILIVSAAIMGYLDHVARIARGN